MVEQYTFSSQDLDRLVHGTAPGRGRLLDEITVGLDPLTDFLDTHYLEDYIPRGGSKIKFVTGRSGSGKTHFSQRMQEDASDKGYIIVSFSARDVWLHDFREIYLEILRQCDIEHILQGCADQIIRELGYDPAQISSPGQISSSGQTSVPGQISSPGQTDDHAKNTVSLELDQSGQAREAMQGGQPIHIGQLMQGGQPMHIGQPMQGDQLMHTGQSMHTSQPLSAGASGSRRTFMDFLSERGEADPISRGEIRTALRTMFTRNPLLDNNFACCCSILTGGILGHPVLEPASRDLVLAFLHGDKTVKLSQLRALGLSPSRITKYNARHLLRSLAEVVHLAGYAGILITVDDLEMLMNRAAGSTMRYTKLRRNDAYESIRQLIDDIDNMHYVFFLFCFDRELMDNENVGFKTYQALWMRIQNEVVSTRFNRFADILDLDRYADAFYTQETLLEMSARLALILSENGIPAAPLTPEDIAGLTERAGYGGIGIPYMVGRAVLDAGKAAREEQEMREIQEGQVMQEKDEAGRLYQSNQEQQTQQPQEGADHE